MTRRSSSTTSSPSPADIRHDNQVAALGAECWRRQIAPGLCKNRRWAGRAPQAQRRCGCSMVDGRMVESPTIGAKIESMVPSCSSQPCPRRPKGLCGVAFARAQCRSPPKTCPLCFRVKPLTFRSPATTAQVGCYRPKLTQSPLAALGGVNGSNAVFDILLKAPRRRSNRVQFPPFDTLLSVPLAEYERHRVSLSLADSSSLRRISANRSGTPSAMIPEYIPRNSWPIAAMTFGPSAGADLLWSSSLIAIGNALCMHAHTERAPEFLD
jgi:hypothetical protein